MISTYVRIAGAGLAVLGTAGLLGLWAVRFGGIVLYLATAAAFLYLGSGRVDVDLSRTLVGGIGALYLLSAVLLFGLYALDPPLGGYHLEQGIVRGTLGVAGVVAAWTLPYVKRKGVPARTLKTRRQRRRKTVTMIPIRAASRIKNTANTVIISGEKSTLFKR